MKAEDDDGERAAIAEAVRRACIKVALNAYESASVSGLCCEGAWECALGALRSLDLTPVLDGLKPSGRVEKE